MPAKKYYAVLDCETSIKNTVADLAILIVDRHGKIYHQMAVLVHGHYDKFPLFYNNETANIDPLWTSTGEIQRRAVYDAMLASGERTLASVNAVNKWINQAIGLYNPILTAYNIAFDLDKCKNTKIDLLGFSDSFCLWHAANGNICNLRQYKQYCLNNHAFNNVTDKGNATFKTNAETVISFLRNEQITEDHTALSDCLHEAHILTHVLKRKKWRSKIQPYNWRNTQLKNHYTAK